MVFPLKTLGRVFIQENVHLRFASSSIRGWAANTYPLAHRPTSTHIVLPLVPVLKFFRGFGPPASSCILKDPCDYSVLWMISQASIHRKSSNVNHICHGRQQAQDPGIRKCTHISSILSFCFPHSDWGPKEGTACSVIIST